MMLVLGVMVNGLQETWAVSGRSRVIVMACTPCLTFFSVEH